MCGIFGIIAPDSLPKAEIVAKACGQIRHRGPDGEGIFQRGPVALGHRRLSIIDLSTGAQPMHSADKRFSITYNGEIYNYPALRKELEAKGYVFSTHSDTETLLYSYAAWGPSCLDRLQGMFAFAIVDYEQEEVFLARDHFGIKPLVYRAGPGFFAFSSEIPPLANIDGLPPLSVDPAAVPLFFRYQYIPSPHSIYAQIRKLPPAHFMRVNFNGNILESGPYWDFSFTPRSISRNEAVDRADELIQSSVLANTLSDVPIGVFLSGGIDSTLVAMNLANSVSRDIPAFTIAFKEQEYSELEYAAAAAKHLGLKLNVSYVEAMALDKLRNILSFYGEPYGDSSVLPTWHVAQLAREHVTVVLSGDGGDEFFGGYHSHAGWLASVRQTHLKNAVRAALRFKPRTTLHHLKRLGETSQKSVEFWHNFVQYYTPDGITALLKPPYNNFAHEIAFDFADVRGREAEFGDLDLVQYLDIKTYMPECILPKVDITSMQHSLEVRPALLDKSILEFALTLPEKHRYTLQEGGKVLFKDILLRNGFDKSFVYRRKQGFGIPVDHWFLKGGQARALLEELFAQHSAELGEYLDLVEARRLMDSHSLDNNVANRLWLLLAFACWVDGKV